MAIASAAADVPVRVEPPARPLPTLRYLATMIRNPLEVWSRAIYEEGLVAERVLGRNAVFVMDPDLVQRVLVDDAENYRKPSLMHRLLGPAVGSGILTSDGAQWRRQRRIVAPLFRPQEVAGYIPAMLDCASRSAARLGAHPDGARINLSVEMMRTTFDVIAEAILSGAESLDIPRFASALETYLGATGWVIAIAQLRLSERFPYPGRRRVMQARDYLREVTGDLVAARRRSQPRHDIIQALVDAKDPDTGQGMSDSEIVDNLLTFIAAGHETTALALTWAFYLLTQYPQVERRVLAEIAAEGGPHDLGPDAIGRLTYTRQVVSEAMRLYPSAPSIVRSPSTSVRLGDLTIEPGTLVFVPIYAIHRHRRLWDEPDRFNPDRFAADAAKARHRFAYLPFGGGPRVCIGMGFAMIEAVAIVARLLPQFRFELAGPAPQPVAKVTLRPRGGMSMRVSARGRGTLPGASTSRTAA